MQTKANILVALCALLLGLTLGACAHEKTNPDDMSAQAHRAEAAAHRKRAAENETALRETGQESSYAGTPINTGREFTAIDDVTWGAADYRWEVAEHERELARAHEEAADELERFTDAQCAHFDKQMRVKCPLLGTVVEVTDVEGGVHFKLRDGVSKDAVLAHSRCHLAFARKEHREGMDACPLYLSGVQAKADEDGLTLTSSSAELKELRRRARTHIGPGHALK